MSHSPRHSARRDVAGFTLIEVTVALVIVVILAAMIVPRFTGAERRQFEKVVEQVNDLMIVYAQRDRLSHKQVGIYHDPEKHWLTVVMLEEEDSDNADEFGWRIDPIVPPVKLPDDVEVIAYEDGSIIDITAWPITNRPDQTRPEVELDLSTDSHSATVALSAHDVSPRVNYAGSGPGSYGDERRRPLDLDGGGRNREEW